jgi:hypothetical protein
LTAIFVLKSVNTVFLMYIDIIKKARHLSRYRPGVGERVGRGIALLFHDCGVRRG